MATSRWKLAASRRRCAWTLLLTLILSALGSRVIAEAACADMHKVALLAFLAAEFLAL